MKTDLKTYFSRILTNEKRRQMRMGVNSEVSSQEKIRRGIHRVPGKTELNAKAEALELKPLHHYIFCTHNVPYWRCCAKCGRDHVNAQRNAEMILQSSQRLVK